jgi:hypothetical protein
MFPLPSLPRGHVWPCGDGFFFPYALGHKSRQPPTIAHNAIEFPRINCMSRPFIPIPNTCSVEMIYSLFGDVVENCFSVKSNTPFTLALCQELRTVFDSWHNTSFKACVGPDTVLQRIRTRALDTNSGATEDYHLPSPRAGTAGAGSFPSNVTLAIKLATALAGRSYRGRIYMPSICTGCAGGNVATPAAVAVYVNSLNALQPLLAAHNANWQICVASRYNNGAWRTVGVCTPATGWVNVNNNLDSQRRRLVGRGHA